MTRLLRGLKLDEETTLSQKSEESSQNSKQPRRKMVARKNQKKKEDEQSPATRTRSKSQEEALIMLQSEKTPKRSSATIRKDLAEKAAAEVKAKTKVQRLEKEAAQAQINFAATLEEEQNRLVAESDADNDVRMKIALVALYPDVDYGVWALAHRYAEDVVYLREQAAAAIAEKQPQAATPKKPGHPRAVTAVAEKLAKRTQKKVRRPSATVADKPTKTTNTKSNALAAKSTLVEKKIEHKGGQKGGQKRPAALAKGRVKKRKLIEQVPCDEPSEEEEEKDDTNSREDSEDA
ncbi:uncharacterized protein LOC110713193 [Chenopodium quinoa]|uniref:uncharacterized protein LOC110713193 n=1 Tax=Chenopodium quinoa TaxID=63459 RepID=UPI000B794955|nr:uncharacterized protein LOC110713193 [Chenopodium quinoa]